MKFCFTIEITKERRIKEMATGRPGLSTGLDRVISDQEEHERGQIERANRSEQPPQTTSAPPPSSPETEKPKEMTEKEITRRNKLLKDSTISYVVYLRDGSQVCFKGHDINMSRDVYTFYFTQDFRGPALIVGMIPVDLVKFVATKDAEYTPSDNPDRRIKT
jgi:hypothetical protein